ncbi:MAG TPA: DUF4126 domain-containing protein [Roseiflexaceae bacterium]|nr:DUF4126 domain-containing protein [Roseiflexaceae bacterium]
MMSLLSAFGLSTAAGLNAYIPLLTIGVLARYTDLITLDAPYDILEHPVVLLVIAVIALLDLIGDKIPAVDHTLHAAGVILAPAAGAVLFLAANSDAGLVHPVFAAICGVIVAGFAHGARATARPFVTATTGGVGNPVVSFLEDVAALILSVLAIILPVLAFLAALAGILLFLALLRRMRRKPAPAS